jgi:hypothetical protein
VAAASQVAPPASRGGLGDRPVGLGDGRPRCRARRSRGRASTARRTPGAARTLPAGCARPWSPRRCGGWRCCQRGRTVCAVRGASSARVSAERASSSAALRGGPELAEPAEVSRAPRRPARPRPAARRPAATAPRTRRPARPRPRADTSGVRASWTVRGGCSVANAASSSTRECSVRSAGFMSRARSISRSARSSAGLGPGARARRPWGSPGGGEVGGGRGVADRGHLGPGPAQPAGGAISSAARTASAASRMLVVEGQEALGHGVAGGERGRVRGAVPAVRLRNTSLPSRARCGELTRTGTAAAPSPGRAPPGGPPTAQPDRAVLSEPPPPAAGQPFGCRFGAPGRPVLRRASPSRPAPPDRRYHPADAPGTRRAAARVVAVRRSRLRESLIWGRERRVRPRWTTSAARGGRRGGRDRLGGCVGWSFVQDLRASSRQATAADGRGDAVTTSLSTAAPHPRRPGARAPPG